MPSSLHVRNLDDDLVRKLKVRAAQNGRSAEAEHREILRQALGGRLNDAFWKKAAQARALTPPGPQTPSDVLLREARDER